MDLLSSNAVSRLLNSAFVTKYTKRLSETTISQDGKKVQNWKQRITFGSVLAGFKRAINIKDFSNTIPGHGGIVDRFDCEFLMAIFVFVYMSTFVKYSKFKNCTEK
ncbi:hypothetical protein HHI36_006206 [Cryptolaemus montrouzieri]|uniref:phosphatidate cytidylyltransferase n=1 Tax=Cryptolaemus montrouzieri TaxID=559131 RepID=A0ABD2NWD2_9CUCU